MEMNEDTQRAHQATIEVLRDITIGHLSIYIRSFRNCEYVSAEESRQYDVISYYTIRYDTIL